ncbi:ABC transporter permease/substrate binding protein [Vagococcus vulneris]|uniref:Glycine/betaine ABC transporter permease n=1 Tax=Vagococcus vulneris TaxID=1977869 RepID=A0A429ZXA5_9ENTE|nr:glycine betaine ABC transporter substrate-binding protein [Vagococcus vulneris]RST98400.1 glycine/betaine ABC transporter permease [Vagococcus vulneris]
MNNLLLMNKLPIADWVESLTDWLTQTFAGLFSFFQTFGQGVMDGVTNLLNLIPPLIFIAIVVIGAYVLSNKKFGLSIFSLIGLLFIYNQGLWSELMSTLTLVVISSLVSIIIGVPLGILMAKSNKAEKIITPILDFMQTMPGFVYLIPAVAFFGIGMVPGVFASVIFALPPTVRFTNLGIRQVPTELVEASDSFGGTGWQKLFKLELPLAKGTILAGINQTTMLSLSMVVIASMIGAPGLGRGVLSALQKAQVGNGFVNGVALVILAIIIDRFTQKINRPKNLSQKKVLSPEQKKKRRIIGGIVALAIVSLGAVSAIKANQKQKNTINISYVEWDTEVASTNVIAEVLKEQGLDVNITPLDNAIVWKSLANGESDAMVGAWLPGTHKALYDEYKNKVDLLGPNLKGAKLGLVVPSYMDVNSIEDLTNQADKKITGIEPGAGVMEAADKTVKDYGNLNGWSVESSSSGAMTVALGQAIKKKEPIVITGWSPHWMFAKYDLKYLEDPKKTMGGEESINTVTRKGFKDDHEKAYNILKKFNWTTDDMEKVMLDINSGKAPNDAAKDWIKDNQDKVKQWTK